MTLKIEIEDGRFGTKATAGVTRRGQIITAPMDYNTTYYNSMDTVTIAYNFIEPRAGFNFVIDGVIFSSDKNVSSTNGAVITLYEADAVDRNVASRELFTIDVGRLDKGSFTGLNVLTSPGVWLNGSTDDATTNVTIVGHYVETVD